MSKNITRCPKDIKKLVNPKTGRCVMESSPIIKKLLKEGYTIVVTPNAKQPDPPPKNNDVKIFRVCPTDPNKLVNPLTGRCLMQKSPIVKKLMAEGWTIAFNDRGVTPVIIKPEGKLKLDKLKKDIDANKDGILSINEYLGSKEITLVEEKAQKGFFKFLKTNENIPLFLNIMAKRDPLLKKNLCISKDRYFLYLNPRNPADSSFWTVVTTMTNKLSDDYDKMEIYRSQTLYEAPEEGRVAENPVLITHPELFNNIRKCKERFYSTPLTLTTSSIYDVGEFRNGHSNVLFFDTKNKTIDRYDPHGAECMKEGDNAYCPGYNQDGIDAFLALEFKKKLPEYRFIDLQTTCPYFGPQIKYESGTRVGYCVTWSLMFVVLRLLNPDFSIEKLNKVLTTGSTMEMFNKMLKFAKFYSDVIKKASFEEINN